MFSDASGFNLTSGSSVSRRTTGVEAVINVTTATVRTLALQRKDQCGLFRQCRRADERRA
jgi:hypothetical protein